MAKAPDPEAGGGDQATATAKARLGLKSLFSRNRTQAVSKVDKSVAYASYAEGARKPSTLPASRRQSSYQQSGARAAVQPPGRPARQTTAQTFAQHAVQAPVVIAPVQPAFVVQPEAQPTQKRSLPKPKPVFQSYDDDAAEEYLARRGSETPTTTKIEHRQIGGRFEPVRRAGCCAKMFWAFLGLAVLGGVVFAGVWLGTHNKGSSTVSKAGPASTHSQPSVVYQDPDESASGDVRNPLAPVTSSSIAVSASTANSSTLDSASPISSSTLPIAPSGSSSTKLSSAASSALATSAPAAPAATGIVLRPPVSTKKADCGQQKKEKRASTAKPVLYGITYQPPGQNETSCPDEEVNNAVKNAAGIASSIRLYTAECGLASMVAQAVDCGGYDMSLWIGLDTNVKDTSFYQYGVSAMQNLSAAYGPMIAGAVVGNEVVSSGWATAQDINDRMDATIQTFKASKSDIKVGTADTDGNLDPSWTQHAQVLLANIHPYWNSGIKDIKDAAPYVPDRIKALLTDQSLKGYDASKLLVGETGWPSGPQNKSGGGIEASVGNADAFFKSFVCDANKAGLQYFIHTLVDQPMQSDPDQRTWGLFDVNWKAKYDFAALC